VSVRVYIYVCVCEYVCVCVSFSVCVCLSVSVCVHEPAVLWVSLIEAINSKLTAPSAAALNG